LQIATPPYSCKKKQKETLNREKAWDQRVTLVKAWKTYDNFTAKRKKKSREMGEAGMFGRAKLYERVYVSKREMEACNPVYESSGNAKRWLAF
jgi:hypothetical protein